MITLSQLEYIAAVARTRSFGKAAQACHISQPSLSAQIIKAEKDCGFALFDRLQRPVAITERGQKFVAQAREVLDQYEKLRQSMSLDKRTLRGRLRLGVIPTLAPYLVPRFILDFAKACPEVHLTIEELPTAVLMQNLRDDALDAGIAATPLEEAGIEEAPLFEEMFYLYAHDGHALLQNPEVDARRLKRHEIWLLADGHCLRNQVSRLCGSRKGGPTQFANVSFEGGTLETLRLSIRHAGGATLVPDLFVRDLSQDEREACVRPFRAPQPFRQISLLQRARSFQNRLTDALCHSVLAGLPKDLSARSKGKLVPLR